MISKTDGTTKASTAELIARAKERAKQLKEGAISPEKSVEEKPVVEKKASEKPVVEKKASEKPVVEKKASEKPVDAISYEEFDKAYPMNKFLRMKTGNGSPIRCHTKSGKIRQVYCKELIGSEDERCTQFIEYYLAVRRCGLTIASSEAKGKFSDDSIKKVVAKIKALREKE